MGLKRILPFPRKDMNVARQPMSPPNSPPLLSIGRDAAILKEREGNLHQAGYDVHTIKIESLIPQQVTKRNMLVLFCQTLTSEECVFLATHFRRYAPADRLILLTEKSTPRLESVLFHATVHVEDGPDALYREIGRLLAAA